MAPHYSKKRKTEAPKDDASDNGGVRLRESSPASSAESSGAESDTGPAASKRDQPQRKKQKKKHQNGLAATASAQSQLAEMYEYKSNVFRMETEELLAETRVNYEKRLGPVQKALHKLKSIIDSIPERAGILVSFWTPLGLPGELG